MLQPYFAIYMMYLPGATFGPATLQSPLSGAHRLFRILTPLSSPSPLLLPTLPQTHRNMIPGLEQDPHEGRTSVCLLQCCFLEPKVRPFMEQTFGKCCRISWCVGRKRGEMGLGAASLGRILFVPGLEMMIGQGHFELWQMWWRQLKVIMETGCSGGRCHLQ